MGILDVQMPLVQNDPAVAIIGAGPYGLSIAAHLQSVRVEFRVFGVPLQGWLEHMPKGMFLKSEGCASNLFDAAGEYTLGRYCADESLPYAPYSAPVALDVFTRYGLSFQQRFVPNVENAIVTAIKKSSRGFEMQMANGERLRPRRVVIATGLSHTAYIPPALSHLPPELGSHSSRHNDMSALKEHSVTVIGGGQSALETAALLHESGAQVRLVIRRPSISWNATPAVRRSVYQRLRRPMSSLGPGVGPWLYSNAPMLFCHLPRQIRTARVQKALGPSGAWWLKHRVSSRIPIMSRYSVVAAEARHDQVVLRLRRPDGTCFDMETEHVIAATGYRFDVRALPFLSEQLLLGLRCLEGKPILSANFESSVPGLYFTGLASANQFGPAMRFLHGAGYTAKRIAGHISGRTHRFSFPFLAVRNHVQRCENA